jgi:hypothetical protein
MVLLLAEFVAFFQPQSANLDARNGATARVRKENRCGR